MEMGRLFDRFDSVVTLDVETTGFSAERDEIIELAALRVGRDGAAAEEFDHLVRLSPGRRLPPKITELTGITEAMLAADGRPKEETAARLEAILSHERVLLVAYNAQFDLGFLYHFLRRHGDPGVLRTVRLLDALTVYKDRRPYPHKLCDAVDAYALTSQNTHRAIDDARATWELLCAMEVENPDLAGYLNLFGYNPKYGVSGARIRSVAYRPQPYDAARPLYEEVGVPS